MKCIYCGCSEWEPCPGGCGWLSLNPPVCDAGPCVERFAEDAFRHRSSKPSAQADGASA